MIDNDLILTIIPWVSEISFFAGLLPQIFLNYKIKSAAGLSDVYLILYFSAYVINIFYVYGLDLTSAHKAVAPLYLFAVTIMIFQKFFYNNVLANFKAAKLYYFDFIILLVFIPFVFMFPQTIAHAAGWALIVMWTLYQFPQIFKIYRNKSVAGFSFLFVSLIGIGNVVEFIVAMILKLPIQTIFITIRGMIIYLVYCFQFWKYRKPL